MDESIAELAIVLSVAQLSISMLAKSERSSRYIRSLFRTASTFFDKAFNGPFKEGAERAVYLPDDDPAVIEVFIAWLYSGTLSPPLAKSSDAVESSDVVNDESTETIKSNNNNGSEDGSGSDDSGDSDGGEGPDGEEDSDREASHHYTALYSFAEKYGIESLQNQVMDKLAEIMTNYTPTGSEVQVIYDNSRKSSPLCKIAVEHIALFISIEYSPEPDVISEYCEVGGDFVKDLMMQLCGVRITKDEFPTAEPSCDHHVRSDGIRCGQKKPVVVVEK